jgi:hypothetical protein
MRRLGEEAGAPRRGSERVIEEGLEEKAAPSRPGGWRIAARAAVR